IQDTDALVRISLNNERIKITAPMVIVDSAGTVDIEGAGAVTVESDAALTLEGASITLQTAGAVSINSASLNHNGTNIGDDHSHTQPPDSSGDVEQPTGGPQ
ncbi:MAG: hypothetical protein K8963_03775, partial [Proteobacteria bacterium]|nr:hypothetical protein [Pseudomonadota bacterium]